MSTPCRFPFALGGFSHHQSTVCHKEGECSQLPSCPMCSHICGCCWSAALLRAFARGRSQSGGSTIITCAASCIGQCVGPEQDWMLGAFREVHCCPLKQSLCSLSIAILLQGPLLLLQRSWVSYTTLGSGLQDQVHS